MNLIFAIFRLFVPETTIDDAVSQIAKGVARLEKVMVNASSSMDKAVAKIEAARTAHSAAEAKIERAARIKTKLEELLA
jgi:hypothetical protein